MKPMVLSNYAEGLAFLCTQEVRKRQEDLVSFRSGRHMTGIAGRAQFFMLGSNAFKKMNKLVPRYNIQQRNDIYTVGETTREVFGYNRLRGGAPWPTSRTYQELGQEIR